MARLLFLSSTALIAKSHLVAPPVDEGFELLVESAYDEYDWTCEDVEGLPSWLNGSLIMPTAARFEYGGRKFQSILDSYGKLTQIQLSGGRACTRAKMLATKFYNDSLKDKTIAPSMLFDETVPPRHCPLDKDQLCALANLAGGNDNVFVKVYNVGGRFFSVTDSPQALEVDPETLGITGKVTWQDDFKPLPAHIPMVGAAHMIPDPVTGSFIGVQQEVNEVSGKGTVDVFEMPLDRRLQRKLIKRYVTDKVRYFHSMGVTPSYVILPHQPYHFDGISTVMQGKTMKEAFMLENGTMEFHLIDRKNPDAEPLVFEVDRFFFQHVANSYENETTVTIDLGHTTVFALQGPLADIKATANKTSRDTTYTKMKICRYHLHTSGAMKGTWSRQVLSDETASTEFMRINEDFKGKPYNFYYGVEWYTGGNVAMGAMGIVKQNVNTEERIHWRGENGQFPSEPVFVPRPKDDATAAAVEDDGALLFTVLDGPSRESFIYVVDPKSMQVLAKSKLPYRLSYTTHGTWFDGLVTAKTVQDNAIVV